MNLGSGHGHVFPLPGGKKARCGGPALCGACAKDFAQANQSVPALAGRMLKMLVEIPPSAYDQGGMEYRCWYCDASYGVDMNLKAAHGESCEYAVLMVDAGVFQRVGKQSGTRG